jgi:hypothetical protein
MVSRQRFFSWCGSNAPLSVKTISFRLCGSYKKTAGSYVGQVTSISNWRLKSAFVKSR